MQQVSLPGRAGIWPLLGRGPRASCLLFSEGALTGARSRVTGGAEEGQKRGLLRVLTVTGEGLHFPAAGRPPAQARRAGRAERSRNRRGGSSSLRILFPHLLSQRQLPLHGTTADASAGPALAEPPRASPVPAANGRTRRAPAPGRRELEEGRWRQGALPSPALRAAPNRPFSAVGLLPTPPLARAGPLLAGQPLVLVVVLPLQPPPGCWKRQEQTTEAFACVYAIPPNRKTAFTFSPNLLFAHAPSLIGSPEPSYSEVTPLCDFFWKCA